MAKPLFHKLEQQVMLWAQDKFLSLRVIYIPGSTNVAADLLSRREVTHRDWKFHLNVVSKICERFYEALVDLSASQEDTITTCQQRLCQLDPSRPHRHNSQWH